MTDTAIEPNQSSATPEAVQADLRPAQRRKFNRAMAIIGLILTILAWVSLVFMEWVPLVLGALGFVASLIGCRIPPGPRRNVATTAAIASGVLLLVIGAIWATILWLI